MAQGLTVNVSGDAGLKKNIQYLRDNFPQWLNAANEATAVEIRERAKSNLKQIDAYDTHELYDSVTYTTFPRLYSAVIYSPAKHAPFIEFGTAPHWPPLDKIRAWCGRKGIPESAAFPIARAISERGTPERPWLYPAFMAAIPGWHERLKTFVAAGLRKIAA